VISYGNEFWLDLAERFTLYGTEKNHHGVNSRSESSENPATQSGRKEGSYYPQTPRCRTKGGKDANEVGGRT